MNLRQYIAIMFFATTLCWVSLLFVVTNIDPFAASLVAFVFFYLSLFLALIGTISLVSLPFYNKLGANELSLHRFVRKSFRNGLFFSSILTILLIMRGTQTFHLWNVTILIIIFSLVISLNISTNSYS